jgi:hypothetical protein
MTGCSPNAFALDCLLDWLDFVCHCVVKCK